MSAEIGIHYLSQLSYFAIPVLLLLGVIGVLPLPEEAILLIAGYFAFEGYLNLYATMLVAFVSVILVENLFFYLGSHGSYFFRRFVNGGAKKVVERQIEKRGPAAAFIARFIPGMRVLTPWVAATSGMRWKKFFFANASGALIQAPLIVGIGYWLGPHIEKGVAFVFSVDEIIPLLFLIVFVTAAIVICLNRRAVRGFVSGGANGRI